MVSLPQSLVDREVKTDFLEKRLEINKSHASADFDGWLMERLAVRPGEDVLDVGCGSGAQTVPFSRLVLPNGSVSALDISPQSVELVRQRVDRNARVEAYAVDMAKLDEMIADRFTVKRYDLAQSCYALYYCPTHVDVLDTMRNALKPGGRCAVFTPNEPHGLVDLAGRFTEIPEMVTDSLTFGPRVLKPYFDENFATVEVHRFHNVISIPTSDMVIEFYRQTTYHDGAAEAPMREAADAAITGSGSFRYEKNGYLIIGRP